MNWLLFWYWWQRNEDARCPRCHKPEDVQRRCAHCGYVSPASSISVWAWVAYSIVGVVAWGPFSWACLRILTTSLGFSPKAFDYYMAALLGGLCAVLWPATILLGAMAWALWAMLGG